jgi:ketosteroid isomerase-like protein
MMPENAEVVQRICEIFMQGRKASEQVFDLFDPELEMHDHPGFPDGETHHGHQGLANWAIKLWDDLGDIEVVPSEFVEAPGGRLLFRIDATVTGKGSGARVPTVVYAVATFRDGRMLRGAFYNTKAEAQEAAEAVS